MGILEGDMGQEEIAALVGSVVAAIGSRRVVFGDISANSDHEQIGQGQDKQEPGEPIGPTDQRHSQTPSRATAL